MASSSFILLLLLFFTSLTAICSWSPATPRPRFPAILIFGDSLADTGNNNFLITPIQANHDPYGHSFPAHLPNGRFTDGKILSDFLASDLGIKDTVPPFLDPELPKDELLTGVCFASSGAGFDNLTSVKTMATPIIKQIDYFQDYIEQLKSFVGGGVAHDVVSNSLAVVVGGSNDFSFNFFRDFTRRAQYDIGGYQDFVLQHLQDFLKELYRLGSRNMMITGLPPLGCLPLLVTTNLIGFGRKCVESLNTDSQTYNQKLIALLPQIQASLPGTKIVYGDLYTPWLDMVDNPQKYGFVETNKGCCGSGVMEVTYFCNKLSKVCSDSTQYFYFDSVHPTEVAYRALADYIWKDALQKWA